MSVGWALVDGVVPLYPLYALLFTHTGLSDPDISALFVIWSAVGLVAEIPLGALADRFSRRAAVIAAGFAKACCYGLWTAFPGFPAFAAGFVLWAIGGAFSSGALEALVYDGLAAAGARERYPKLLGRIRAAELLAQLPTAAAATVLFSLGGYVLVGWASVVSCVCSAALAWLLPEAPGAEEDDEPTYWATLRAGLTEVVAGANLRRAVFAVALLGGLDAVEEYVTLMAGHWGVAVAVIPFAVLVIPLAGALGAAVGGRHGRLRPASLGVVLGVGATVLGAAGLLHQPVGLVGVALFYCGYRLVWLVADARLQDHISGSARATVTSVAEIGTEVTCFLVYGAWAVGRTTGVAALCLAVAIVLAYGLRFRKTSDESSENTTTPGRTNRTNP